MCCIVKNGAVQHCPKHAELHISCKGVAIKQIMTNCLIPNCDPCIISNLRKPLRVFVCVYVHKLNYAYAVSKYVVKKIGTVSARNIR